MKCQQPKSTPSSNNNQTSQTQSTSTTPSPDDLKTSINSLTNLLNTLLTTLSANQPTPTQQETDPQSTPTQDPDSPLEIYKLSCIINGDKTYHCYFKEHPAIVYTYIKSYDYTPRLQTGFSLLNGMKVQTAEFLSIHWINDPKQSLENTRLAADLLNLDAYSWRRVQLSEFVNNKQISSGKSVLFPMTAKDVKNIMIHREDRGDNQCTCFKCQPDKNGTHITYISGEIKLDKIPAVDEDMREIICTEIFKYRFKSDFRSKIYKEYFDSTDRYVNEKDGFYTVRFKSGFLDNRTYLDKEITAVVPGKFYQDIKKLGNDKDFLPVKSCKEFKYSDIKYDVLRKACKSPSDYCYIQVNHFDEFIVPYDPSYRFVHMLNLKDLKITNMVFLGNYSGLEMNAELWRMIYDRIRNMTCGFNLHFKRDGIEDLDGADAHGVVNVSKEFTIPDKDGDKVRLGCSSIGLVDNGMPDTVDIIVDREKLKECYINRDYKCNCLEDGCNACVMSFLNVKTIEYCRWDADDEGDVNEEFLAKIE